jgi:lipopolysaccharide transport system permease protein
MISKRLKSTIILGIEIAKADIKQKHEGSYLGILWYLLEPVAMFAILLSIRGYLSGGSTKDFGLYLLIGLIIYNFFRKLTSTSSTVISSNANILRSMKIEPEALVISNIIRDLFAHCFEMLILFVSLVFFSVPGWRIIVYLAVFIPYILFLVGISFFLTTLGAYVSDIKNIWNVFTRLLWFATPIFYFVKQGSLVYYANLCNPLYYFITIMRDFLIGGKLSPLWMWLAMWGFGIVFFFVGLLFFSQFRHRFAESI